MRVKICGITQVEQGQAIAAMGATALGFICVPQSPRYVSVEQIREVVQHLPTEVDRVGVFANASLSEIVEVVTQAGLTVVQLHGNETADFAQQVRQQLPQVELIKAVRVRSAEQLAVLEQYRNSIDTLLLDAYHPDLLGGTGKTLDWQALQTFQPFCPWLLAGGLTPDNVRSALSMVHPDGIDLSSGVERSPGDKDLQKVAALFAALDSMPF
ncbi:MAG TPA: phosphoribosylanthranilate isomerase [Allocoleopsis sp.]